MVADEAAMVVDRINGSLATVGVVIQRATATTGMSASRESIKMFNELIKGLTGD